MKKKLINSLILLFIGALSSAESILRYDERIHPEIGKEFMVVTQNFHATRVGYEILKKGGNAVDASTAIGFALAVTLPRAGNLGGGGFMLIYDKNKGEISSIDYRSAAPAIAKSSDVVGKNGKTIRYGHKVTAVPGSVAGLLKAHSERGTLSLKEVMEPAIRLAEEGIEVTYDLNQALKFGESSLLLNSESKNKYFIDGEALPVKSIFKQPHLAKTLRLISTGGAKEFYEGTIADWIVESSKKNGGFIRKSDLASYQAKERTPLMINYRGSIVVSMPPAASGGLVMLQTLNILERFPVSRFGHNSSRSIHYMAESMKLAWADRDKYHGDPDYVEVPVKNLLSKEYAKKRAKMIDSRKANDYKDLSHGIFINMDESPDTTHYSVVDSYGNAVSNTYTLGSSFGSGVTVEKGGFLLNNQMRNFSRRPEAKANKLEPGKRMISTQTPTLVFNKEGDLTMVLGSPGGGRIPNVISQVISNVIDHKLGYSEALIAPRINQRYTKELELETGFSRDTTNILKRLGHTIKDSNLAMGSVQAIFIEDGNLYGVPDTRRPGASALSESN